MDLPSVKPESPWRVRLSRISSERTILMFESPEEERVIGMVWPVYWNIARPIATQRERYVWERTILDEVVWANGC